MRSPRTERALALACALAADAAAQTLGPKPPTRFQGCAFELVAAVNFGTYDDASPSPVLTTATFRVKCAGVGNQDVVFASGPSTVTGDFQDRRMRGPDDDRLRYQLYTNAARTTVWGDGTRDTSPIVVHQSGAHKDITVYGELFAGQVGEVGAYSDRIVVTILP